jgi:hypothetical protein
MAEVVHNVEVGRSVQFVSLDMEMLVQPTPYRIYQRPKKWAWLAGLCWKFLHKVGALEMFSEKVQTWTYRDIDKKALTEHILRMQDELYRYGRNPEDYVLVMGGADFQELVGSPTFREGVMCFSTDAIHTPYRKFYGVDIHVIGHLRGTAMIPRALVEREVSAPVHRLVPRKAQG